MLPWSHFACVESTKGPMIESLTRCQQDLHLQAGYVFPYGYRVMTRDESALHKYALTFWRNHLRF
jgi:hypothetical protein